MRLTLLIRGAIIGAMVGALGQLVAICYAVHVGYGLPWHVMVASDRLVVEQSLYASQILYVASVGAARVSATLFVASVLARDPRNVLISKMLTGLCGAWTVASIVAISVRGDMLQPWDTYNGSQPLYVRWVAIEVTGFVLDLVAAAVIVYFVCALQMKASRKIAVSSILNCRLLLADPIGIRLYYLQPSSAIGASTTAETIRQVIIGCNIVFASLACLKPFLKPFDTAAFGSHHASRTGIFRYTNELNKSATYYELSANNNTNRSMTGGVTGNRKSMVMHSQRSIASGEDDEIPLTDNASSGLRPGRIGHTAEIRHSDVGDDGHGGNISKTQTWTVSVG